MRALGPYTVQEYAFAVLMNFSFFLLICETNRVKRDFFVAKTFKVCPGTAKLNIM
jgi:hypothetical protein